MFDRIAHVVLLVRDPSRDLRLYRDHLGFEEHAHWSVPDASIFHRLWRIPAGPIEVVELAKPGAFGGEILLVSGPGLPGAAPRSMALPGPFALDFYVRDLAELHARLAADGFSTLSQPVRYGLFGTNFEVDEVILRAPSGLVHALVEWLPDRHRCLLSSQPDQRVSEIVALVTLSEDVEAGLVTLRDSLAGTVYLDTTFSGVDIERLLSLPSGTQFRAALLRGPLRGNARFELMTTSSGVAPALGELAEAPRSHPGAIPLVTVPSLDDALAMLGSAHGPVSGPATVDAGPYAGSRSATLWAPWGGPVGLVEPLPERDAGARPR